MQQGLGPHRRAARHLQLTTRGPTPLLVAHRRGEGPGRPTGLLAGALAVWHRRGMERIDLDVRRPLWQAMSELFLDTETRWAVPLVALAGAKSGLPLEGLDEVFWCEVFPLAVANLHQVVGEWAALTLPDAELEARAGKGWRRPVAELTSGWMVRDQWAAALRCTARLRQEPPASWRPLARAWYALGRRFFEAPHESPLTDLAQELADVRREGVDPAAEWRFFEPVARPMLLGGEPATPRAEAVLELLARG